MTPSINRLAAAAEALGAYILDAEYTQVREDFNNVDVPSLDSFKEWVTNYQYYNALVCVCGGQIYDINTALQADYEELVVEFARTEVAA
jgi:hypothetical protein